MNIGRICAISFGDVAGTFLVGLILGVVLCVLVQMALRKDTPNGR